MTVTLRFYEIEHEDKRYGYETFTYGRAKVAKHLAIHPRRVTAGMTALCPNLTSEALTSMQSADQVELLNIEYEQVNKEFGITK